MSFRVLRLLLFVFGLGLGAGCRSEWKEFGASIKWKELSLSNGLKAYLIQDPRTTVASLQMWYRVGSIDEEFGATGMAHLFEHLMFKGTEKFGNQAFFQKLEKFGAEVNAYTTRDFTVYYETMAPHLLKSAIELEADRVMGLVLNERKADLERQVVLEERHLEVQNDPKGLIEESLWALAFRSHPYHWPVVGYSADIVTMPIEKIKAFYKKFYVPSNATLVLVGNFDLNQASDWIKSEFGPLPKVPRPKRKFQAEEEQTEERRLTLHLPVRSERLTQAYHVPSAFESDAFALDVLASILFDGESSRAHRKLVEEERLALSVSGFALTPMEPGLFTMEVNMREGKKASDGEASLMALLNSVKETGVTEQEVKEAVQKLTVRLLDPLQTSFGIGQMLGTLTTLFDDPARLDKDLTKYTNITPRDVKRVLGRYFDPNFRTVIITLPETAQSKAEAR